MQWFELDEFIQSRYFNPLQKNVKEALKVNCPKDVIDMILYFEMNTIHEDYIHQSINNIIDPYYNDFIIQIFNTIQISTSLCGIMCFVANSIIFAEYKPWITTLIAINVIIYCITQIIHFVCILKVYDNARKYESLFEITTRWEDDNDAKLKYKGAGIFKYQTEFNNLVLKNFGKWFGVLQIAEIQNSKYKKFKLPPKEIIHWLFCKYIWPCILLIETCKSITAMILSLMVLGSLSGLWMYFKSVNPNDYTWNVKKITKIFLGIFLTLEIIFILRTIVSHTNAYYNDWLYVEQIRDRHSTKIWYIVTYLLPLTLWWFTIVQQGLHQKLINMNQQQYEQLFETHDISIFKWIGYVLSGLFVVGKPFKIIQDKHDHED